MSSLVPDGFGKLSSVHPSVDVHVHVEFFRGVSKHEREHTTKRIRLTIAHDEFPFVVADGAVGPCEMSVGSALA